MLAQMRDVPCTRYRSVRVAAWSCRSVAGDAAATFAAVQRGQPCLRRRDGLGWCGQLGDTPAELIPLAVATALPAWQAIAAAHVPAIGCAASKGDVTALRRALRGAPGEWLHAGAERAGLAVARACGVRLHLPVAAVGACASGLLTILAGADLIDAGLTDSALVGAADASLDPFVLAGFAQLGVLGDDAQSAGFAPAEGAGFLALAHHGAWRFDAGVRLGDARHATRCEDPEVLAGMLQALWQACPAPELIVTHGTGTTTGEAFELAALGSGPWAQIPRLVCKPVIGHCLGASSAVELAAALETPARRVWKIALGFGGHVAGIALSRD